MKIAYGLTVCDRLIARLRKVSEQAGHPPAIEDCLFDVKVLKDLMELRRADLHRFAAKYKSKRSTRP